MNHVWRRFIQLLQILTPIFMHVCYEICGIYMYNENIHIEGTYSIEGAPACIVGYTLE